MQTVVRFSKCKQGYGTKKSLHKQTGKALPSREAPSSVLCSDSICSKTAPIALNALRIEPKYLYDLFFCIQLSGEYIMGSRRMSTNFYDSKTISARCSRMGQKFQQNAKYDEISVRKARVIYLCSTEGERLADGYSLHHLPAFILPILLPERGQVVTPRRPLLRKGIIAASGYLAQMWALRADS